MEFTLGRIKTQVGPLTQGKATRELNLQIMPESKLGSDPGKCGSRPPQGHTQYKDPDNTRGTTGPASDPEARDLRFKDIWY